MFFRFVNSWAIQPELNIHQSEGSHIGNLAKLSEIIKAGKLLNHRRVAYAQLKVVPGSNLQIVGSDTFQDHHSASLGTTQFK
jgi:hypothetical protein